MLSRPTANAGLSAPPDLRLLFDQNLSDRLIKSLADLFTGSVHVKEAGLASASDRAVWDFARQNGLAIISKDSDFHQMSFLYGAPPKTIWLRLGNASTQEIEYLIRAQAAEILRFLAADEGALLVIDSKKRQNWAAFMAEPRLGDDFLIDREQPAPQKREDS